LIPQQQAGAETQFIEKWALRAAFDDPDAPWLPPEVLWRQKEQFSDGVGYGWIDGLKDHASSVRTNKNEPTIF
jgi:asparagine synthase (glutamine-hydrolysing)